MTSERRGSEEKTVAEKALSLSLSVSRSFVPRRTFGGYFFCLTKAPYALLLFVTLVLERAKVAMRIYTAQTDDGLLRMHNCLLAGRKRAREERRERVRRRRCTMWQVCASEPERDREPASDTVGPKGFDVSSRFGGDAAPGSSISGV